MYARRAFAVADPTTWNFYRNIYTRTARQRCWFWLITGTSGGTGHYSPTTAIPTTAIYPLFLHTTKFLRRPHPDPNRTLTLALTLTIAAVGIAAVVQRMRGSGDDALYELTFPIIPRLHDTTGLTTGLTTGGIV